MNKRLLKQLIKEVIKEAEGSSPSPQTGPVLPNTAAAMEKEKDTQLRDTVIKLRIRGMKSGAPTWKEFLANVAYDAKMKDLELIHAEIEKAGKKMASMSGSELKANAKDPDDEFDTTPSQSVTDRMRRTNKMFGQRPPIKGGPEDWEKATNKDMEDTRAKTAMKKAMLAKGSYDPEDTALWTDKEWDAWEEKDRALHPKAWGEFDKFVKQRQKT